MSTASRLVNRAQVFAKLRFWKREDGSLSGRSPDAGRSGFTTHMVALVIKLVQMRGSDGVEEFRALCKVFHLAPGLRQKLQHAYTDAVRDPLPAEYHAKQIAMIYWDRPHRCEAVLERFIRIAAASRSFIGRQEYHFLQAVADAMKVSDRHFTRLCGRYHIEVPSDNPYTVLGVGRMASQREIRQKYHSLVREYHPDKVTGSGYSASEAAAFSQKLAEINRAYRALRETVAA